MRLGPEALLVPERSLRLMALQLRSSNVHVEEEEGERYSSGGQSGIEPGKLERGGHGYGHLSSLEPCLRGPGTFGSGMGCATGPDWQQQQHGQTIDGWQRHQQDPGRAAGNRPQHDRPTPLGDEHCAVGGRPQVISGAASHREPPGWETAGRQTSVWPNGGSMGGHQTGAGGPASVGYGHDGWSGPGPRAPLGASAPRSSLEGGHLSAGRPQREAPDSWGGTTTRTVHPPLPSIQRLPPWAASGHDDDDGRQQGTQRDRRFGWIPIPTTTLHPSFGRQQWPGGPSMAPLDPTVESECNFFPDLDLEGIVFGSDDDGDGFGEPRARGSRGGGGAPRRGYNAWASPVWGGVTGVTGGVTGAKRPIHQEFQQAPMGGYDWEDSGARQRRERLPSLLAGGGFGG